MATTMTPQDIEQKESEWAQLGAELYDDLQKLKADKTTPPVVIERHEKALGALQRAYSSLREPDEAVAHEARDARRAAGMTDGEGAALAKAEDLLKADPTLGGVAALKEALKDPELIKQYLAQSGTTATVTPAHAAGFAKAESAVGLSKAEQLAESIQKREGVSAAEAFRRAMRDPGVASEYARERGGLAAAA